MLPIDEETEQPVYFVEVQFQKDQQLYHRFFAELFLYIDQNPETHDWQGVLIYPNRNTEPDHARLHQVLIASPKVRRIYLDELRSISELSLGTAITKLIIEPEETAPEQARRLIERSQQESVTEVSRQAIVDLIETIIMYKFTTLSFREIQTMLGLDDLRQSRAYRETLEEGRQEASGK